MGGVLYHGRYFHLLEELRENFFRSIGQPYVDLTKQGIHLAVLESSQKFRSPIYYGDEVDGRIWFSDLRRTSFVANYQLILPVKSADPVHLAETKHACIAVQPDSGFKIAALQEKLLEGLKPYTV